MNRYNNDLSLAGAKYFRPLFSAIAVFGVVLMFTLLFSLIAVYTPVGMNFINIASTIIFYIGAFVTGIFSGKKATKNGWLKGLLGSSLYFLILFLVGSILNKTFGVNMSVILKFLLVLFTGATGGVFGINLK